MGDGVTDRLQFDRAAHRYSVNGQELPGVSRVLWPVSPWNAENNPGVSHEVLQNKAAIGRAAHRAIELDIAGQLDASTLHPLVSPYFTAWQRFQSEAQYLAAESELRVWHPGLGYAGTLDSLGYLHDRPALVDFKCTVDVGPTVGPQTAAYREAAASTPELDPELREIARDARRWCLQLKADGTYRLVPLDDPNDLRVFLALLTVHNFKIRHANHY
ncbi:hypothetical protein AB3X94_37430 [Paraburkholderia sp. BR10923]|uniref:hypothetical protein n=1 Tax=Paraburkholderia sp. BR10923 TaxID=3236992 RepID=UPI0034CEC7F6